VPHEPQRYFFVHMQKTAGTSLHLRMRRFFGETAIYPTRADKHAHEVATVLDVGLLQETFETRRSELRVVSGHFPLCVSEMLGAPFKTFTVLRDPVERTLSFLRHNRKVTGSPETLEEIYSHPVRFHGLIANHMVKMLSIAAADMTHGVMTHVEFNDGHLETAKRNLAQRIDVFGLQDHFESFCDELSARYGWDLGEPVLTLRTDPEEVSDAFRAQIAHDNRADVDLYAYARTLWSERHREAMSSE
jgi:hypothetical protein